MQTVDYRVVGLGLAGALVAQALEKRGRSFVVVDNAHPGTASSMAPGLVNPLAGRRFAASADLPGILTKARHTYAQMETRLGRQLWHDDRIRRLFRDADERAAFEAAALSPHTAPYVASLDEPGRCGPGIHDPEGSFLTAQSGWVDLPVLVEALREEFRQRGRLVAGLADAPTARWSIYCQGWRVQEDQRWNFVDWNPARGETLTLRLEGTLPRQIYHQGFWLQPLVGDLWRAGATYAWREMEAPPQTTARQTLEQGLRAFLKLPYAIVDQQWGVRPTVRDYYPVLGRHPEDPAQVICNGFGTRGVIFGPLYVEALLAALEDGQPLPAEWDVARFAHKKAPGPKAGGAA